MSAPPGDVADRLERLAQHAPATTATPDLVWSRGRRRQRVRRASALASVAALGVLVTAAAPAVLGRAVVHEVASSERMVLPDVLEEPGGGAAAFPAAPGRLSAVGGGERSGLLGGASSLWGVSASTGESRWLDLADVATGPSVSAQLSADGRRLAYWVTGETSGEPLSSGSQVPPGATGVDPQAVVGVAVMELETGDVTRWDVESEHGLWAQGLVWAGDVLWWQGGPIVPVESGATSADISTHTWDVETDERTEPAGRDPRATAYLAQPGHAPGGFVTLPRTFRLEQVTGSAAPVSLRMDLPPDAPSSAGLVDPEMAPDGARVAALMIPEASQYDETAKQLLVGAADDGTVTLQPVAGLEAQAVLGWRSPTDVVVSSWTGTDEQGLVESQQVWVVDVTTGRRTDLLDLGGIGPDSVAADAWAGEVVDAPGAAFAPDPRWFGAGAVVLGMVLMAGGRVVRGRRVHP